MFDEIIDEIDRWVDRLAPRRTLTVSNDEGTNWTAAIGDNVLYRSPDRSAVVRFALAFQERTPGITVEYEEYSCHVRVHKLQVVQ